MPSMLPAPDLIIACPHCQAATRVFQTTSGNTIGAVTWTDGWLDAPLLPRPPRIGRCAKCARIFWVAEAPVLGLDAKLDGFPDPDPAWGVAEHVETLDEAACLRALDEGLGFHPELELELRVLAWWRGNDPSRRSDAQPGHPTSHAALANLEKLVPLLEQGDEELQLYRCEALRELGRFDEAERALDHVCCSDWRPARERMIELLRTRSRRVEVMFTPLDPADIPPEHLPQPVE